MMETKAFAFRDRWTVLFALVTLTVLRAGFAAEDAAHPPDPSVPLAWVYPPAAPLRCHIVRGLWSREYRLEEALARSGAASITESWHAQGIAFGYVGGWDPKSSGSVPDFPPTAEDLLANHLLILCNVNALAFSPQQQKMIRDFVENGGALLLLGGRFAFGSQWNNTPLADLAPATFVAEGFDLKSSEKGLALAPGPDPSDAPPSIIRWNPTPRVFWYHDVKPKAGAKVILSADGHPLLIVGAFGRGRVALFAGSVMGDPPTGSLAFWESDDWPRLLSETINWLAVPRAQLNSIPREIARQEVERTLKLLEASNEEAAAQTALKKAMPLLVRAAKLCRDPVTAELLVNALARGEADLSPGLAELLGRRAAALLGPRGAAPAARLLDSRKTAKTALALRLLGASHSAGSGATLIRYLASGDVAKPHDVAAVNDDVPLTSATKLALPGEKEAVAAIIRQAALEGLVSLGDPTTLPAIQQAVRDNEKRGRFDKITDSEGIEAYHIPPETRLYQTGLVAALKCGDATAAAPLADALLGNVYVAARARSGWRDPTKSEKNSRNEAADLADILTWQADLLDMLRGCSDAQVEPLAPAMADITDIRIVPAACAVFAGRTLSGAAKAALRKSEVKAVAALSEQPPPT